jgi:mRNA-degrading endonuclease RelE of RelBE toxin-antitoxin system
MASKVVLLSHANEDLARLEQQDRKRVATALYALEEFPENKVGILKLKPPFNGFRKRAGNYRIVFDYKSGIVLVRRIMDRKDAYK